MSLRRQNRWMIQNVTATVLFWAGIAILPAYLLQDNLLIRIGQVILFAILTAVAGKRLLWLYFGTIFFAIVVFHLLVPTGAVLVEIFGFPVTLGAFRTGAFKALTIIGMVFLSLLSVRADLRIPGRLGAVAGRLFWAFEQIMERRDEIDVKAPLHSTDAMLLGIYGRMVDMDESVEDTRSRKATAHRTSFFGWIAVAVVVVPQWFALVLSMRYTIP